MGDHRAGVTTMRAVRRGTIFLVLALALTPPGLGTTAGAAPLERDEVPAPLAPWIDWVLRGHEEKACPFLHGNRGQHVCRWPSELALDLDAREGRFTQRWLVHRETWVPLPGDAKRWPLGVRANGAPVAVVARGNSPQIRLPAGSYDVTGAFRWDALPEWIRVPPATGIVRLELSGSAVPFPNRDADGRLWLRQRDIEEAAAAEQRLEVTVHRRLADDVPLFLETRIALDVSGRSREMVLGRVLPEGFEPLSLVSPLPRPPRSRWSPAGPGAPGTLAAHRDRARRRAPE